MLSGIGDRIVAAIEAPFRIPFDPGEKVWIPYLAAAAVLAFAVFRRSRVRTRFLDWCFPKEIWRHRSTRLDLAYVPLNAALWLLLVKPWFLTQTAAAAFFARAAERVLGPRGEPPFGGGLAVSAALTLAAIVLADFCAYGAHWLQHRVPFLWQFHKVHHSAEVLTPFTVYRMHPVDDLLSGFLIAIAMGALAAAAFRLFPPDVAALQIAGVNAIAFAFLLVANLRHSHVWLSFGPRVEKWLVSPAQHQVHHSDRREHHDRNFGVVFAVWDRVFGTLHIPKGPEEITGLGLGGEEREFSSVLRLYALPFRKALFR